MFRRILIPTDFSAAAEWVFDDAVRIAGASGAEIVILHVRMTWGANPDDLRFPADPSLYEYVERQELQRLRELVNRSNASIETRLIVRNAPDPGHEIARTAKMEGADLIVIATHARHHVAHFFVGSTTLSVLGDPPCPVLAIRYGIHRRASLSRIVVPTHRRQETHAAFELAKELGSEIHLVTVCNDDERPAAEDYLKTMAAPLRNAKAVVIRGEDPEKEIVRYAQKVDADAIFVNARPAEGKLDIIRAASVPVMIVPPAPRAGA